MSLRTSLNIIARKMLFLWVKTEVLPSQISALKIQADQPVVYVLEARAWSHLLVLEQECERLGLPLPMNLIPVANLSSWHSVYTTASREPFKAWLQKQPKRSRMLRGLLEVLRDNPEQDIQFVPVSVFWGRPVGAQKHWYQLLFADSGKITGKVKKLFTIFIHGRSTFIKFSPTISFRSECINGASDDTVIDNLQALFSSHLREVKSATLGPDMSHRGDLVRKIILTPDVQTAIKARSIEDNKTEYQATLQARRYLNEIVANCTNITIQVMQRGLTAFWNRFYSGIQVSNSDSLKDIALSHELIYVPCHRSHIDYLLLSYVIYSEGFAIPYIAAGRNLNMPIIGSILRGGGAFFIRRSFKGNQLYSTVMFEYVAELISKGVAIAYFVEGGRSRTGRLLQPKPGMLSMTVRGFLKYRRKPVAFVPVYIGYEKLLESKAYQAELSGEDKKSETFINSLRSMLRIHGRFGRVHTNFGEPIFLNEVLDQQQPSWHTKPYDDAVRPDWLRSVVDSVSLRAMQRINEAVTINAVNLVSTALLASNKQSMDENELCEILESYQLLISSLNYSDRLILTQKTGKELVERTHYLKLVKRRKHALGDMIYLDAKGVTAMTYYRNNVLHLMALPSIIACCFSNRRSMNKADIMELVRITYPFIQNELFLVWSHQELGHIVDTALEQMCELSMLRKQKDDGVYSRYSLSSTQNRKLLLLSKIMSPILELYYLILALLSKTSASSISKLELQEQCYLLSQRVAMTQEYDSPDFSDKHLIANFIDAMIKMNYVALNGTDSLRYTGAFERSDRRVRLLISKELRAGVLHMIREPSNNS